MVDKKSEEIQRISGLSKEEAKQILLNELENELTQESAVKIREYERYVKDESKKSLKTLSFTPFNGSQPTK